MTSKKPNQSLSLNSRILLVIHVVFNTSTALSSLFVSIYLWRLEPDFTIVAIYHLMLFIFSTLLYAISGWLMTKWRVVSLYRTGIVLHCLFYFLLLWIEGEAAYHAIELGIVQGIALGCYWLSYNVLSYDATNPVNRHYFFGINGLLISLAGALGPLFSGILLEVFKGNRGYVIVFWVSLILFATSAILSVFVKSKDALSSYKLGEVLRSTYRNANWRSVLCGSFMYGIREGIFMFIIVLLFYVTTASELSLGWFTSLTSFLSMLVYYLVGLKINTESHSKYILIGAVGITIGTLILSSTVNLYSLLIFGIVNAIFLPFILIPYSSISFNVIEGSFYSSNLRIEHIVAKEIFSNIGRVIPVTLFIFFYDNASQIQIMIFLILPTISLFGVWRYFRKINLV
ncbi:MFS transporter [Gracilibacillus sp. Marseille-QA3620]